MKLERIAFALCLSLGGKTSVALAYDVTTVDSISATGACITGNETKSANPSTITYILQNICDESQDSIALILAPADGKSFVYSSFNLGPKETKMLEVTTQILQSFGLTFESCAQSTVFDKQKRLCLFNNVKKYDQSSESAQTTLAEMNIDFVAVGNFNVQLPPSLDRDLISRGVSRVSSNCSGYVGSDAKFSRIVCRGDDERFDRAAERAYVRLQPVSMKGRVLPLNAWVALKPLTLQVTQ